MSGTAEDISQVHWKQQWLENGTLYFHVSMTESELLAQTTQSTAREPAHVLHEHMHLLHISVMVSVDAFLCFFYSSAVFSLCNHFSGEEHIFIGCKLRYEQLFNQCSRSLYLFQCLSSICSIERLKFIFSHTNVCNPFLSRVN